MFQGILRVCLCYSSTLDIEAVRLKQTILVVVLGLVRREIWRLSGKG